MLFIRSIVRNPRCGIRDKNREKLSAPNGPLLARERIPLPKNIPPMIHFYFSLLKKFPNSLIIIFVHVFPLLKKDRYQFLNNL